MSALLAVLDFIYRLTDGVSDVKFMLVVFDVFLFVNMVVMWSCEGASKMQCRKATIFALWMFITVTGLIALGRF